MDFFLDIFCLTTGFWISIGLGTFLMPKIWGFFSKDIKRNYREIVSIEKGISGEAIPELDDEKPVSHIDWLMGVIERFILTVFVAFSLKNAIVAMGGWIALKLAAGWQRRKIDRPYELFLIRLLTLNALMNSVISLCFAIFGGVVFGFGIVLITKKAPIDFLEYLTTLFKN